MTRATLMRIWKAAFATLVVAGFVWFCFFWQQTFAGNRVAAAPSAKGLPAGTACAPLPEKVDDRSLAVAAAELDDADQDGPQDGAQDVAQDDGSDDDAPSAGETRAKTTMFRSRIYGPYALSVRDGLNEMMIGTHLLAAGIQAAAGPGGSLEQIMAAIPSLLPTHGYISSGFGPRRSPFTGRVVHHNGIDFAVYRGAPVYATADGVVTFAGRFRALGKTVILDHGYGIRTRYGHNSATLVQVGDHVRRGDLIAKVGSTGRSTGPHVHYEVWVKGHAIDPSHFMFEVPDRPLEQVALNSFGGQVPAPGLGLAMGGDGEPILNERVRAALPPPTDRRPINLAINGIFGLVALMMVWSLVPRRHDP